MAKPNRAAPARGRIALPEIEIAALDQQGEPRRIAHLRAPARSRLARWIFRGRERFELVRGRDIGPEQLPEHERWTVLEVIRLHDAAFVEQERCVLHVRPGMQGEIVIGVSRMSVAQVLADPALREAEGTARIPLPHGARVRLTWGPLSLHARIGGPPLFRPTLTPDPFASPSLAT